MKTLTIYRFLSVITASLIVVGCKPSERQSEEGSKVVVSTSAIDDMEQLQDSDYCFENYPEILYLVQKGHPNAARAAFKAAYRLAKTDGNYSTEVENLVLYAFYASTRDISVWQNLEVEERRLLYSKIDELKPMDWVSVKTRYSEGSEKK